MTSIRFLAPHEPLFPHEIRVILRTMGHVEHGIAVRDNQFICDLFLFASHIFDVDYTRISLALDMKDIDEETKKKYEGSGGFQVLTGYERIDTLVEPLERAGHIMEILIRDPSPLSH